MDYITGGSKKIYMRIKKKKNKSGKISADVSRISCQEYDDPKKNKSLGRIIPKVNDKVIIIIKPYHNYTCITGVVDKVLTRRPTHTRGHKVKLQSGVIGRTLKILTK